MNNSVAITCHGVSKSFPILGNARAWRAILGLHDGEVFKALENVTFDVPKGQFVGILGKNGAGKSTLLRVLGGVYSADEGVVELNGALSGLYELGLAGHPELSGRAYADRLLTMHGFSKQARVEMIEEAHEFSELGERFDDPVLTYSSGMAARLFFSVATAGKYDVYLIDEVLAVGDQHFQSKCWRRLRERVSQGASGILVTHDWTSILRLCETTHILENGKIVFSGQTDLVVRRYLYGEEAKDSFIPGIANFLDKGDRSFMVEQGAPFKAEFEVEVLKNKPIYLTSAIERLQPGFGWEVSMMTRKPEKIAGKVGRYSVSVGWPDMPLSKGEYRLSVGLLTPDPLSTGSYIAVDGLTWLNGNNILLVVDGASSIALRTQWSFSKELTRNVVNAT